MRFNTVFLLMLEQDTLKRSVSKRRRWQALKRWRYLPSYQRRRQARRQRQQFQQQRRRQQQAALRRRQRNSTLQRLRWANWRKTM